MIQISVKKVSNAGTHYSSAMLYSLRISLGLVFPLSNDASLFFIFILLFWNHILMCFSERLNDFASSILRALVMYRLNKNSFSNSTCCLVVYAVLARERTFAELQDSLPRPLGLSSAVKKTKISEIIFNNVISNTKL